MCLPRPLNSRRMFSFLFTGGLLLEAAKALQDESILAKIRGQDLVAIEVRYHRSCYKDYTGFLTRPGETSHIHHTRKHLRCSAVLLLTHAPSISCI